MKILTIYLIKLKKIPKMQKLVMKYLEQIKIKQK